MEKITKNEKNNFIIFIISVIITSIFMCVFITQKNGWHEDEIFSYGSSNYKYDNLFCTFAEKDSLNQVMDEKINDKNPIKMIQNIAYYITHQSEFSEALGEKMSNETPIWKTKEQAKDYVTVSSDEILSYYPVYYNQSRDVHPPLFYMAVHFVSSIALNQFSKYIIFAINLFFYIGTCFAIRNIMKLFGKDNLSWIAVLLYGLSMGGISTVIFQRMYMMLTFFALIYLYLTIKICKSNFEFDKKTKRNLVLTIILGFLTQYYFCIYIVLIAIVIAITMIKMKKFKELKQYIWCHVKAALIGIIIFPASIYHIFFSYRGAAGGVVDTSYIERLIEYIGLVFYAFSIPKVLGYIIIVAMFLLLIFKLVKTKNKTMTLIISVPVILFILIVAKIAPFVNIRYISLTIPIICIAAVASGANIIRYVVDNVLKVKYASANKNERNLEKSRVVLKYVGVVTLTIITIGISTYGLVTNEPQFLYKSYSKRIEIAEKYKELKLVYVGQSYFNHLQDMEEFLRYNKTLITNTWNLEVLKDNEGLDNEKEFILNVKCWISDYDENLEKILEYTGAKDYELLLDDGESRVYKVQR